MPEGTQEGLTEIADCCIDLIGGYACNVSELAGPSFISKRLSSNPSGSAAGFTPKRGTKSNTDVADRESESSGFPIVGIGASAGGLEACSEFFEGGRRYSFAQDDKSAKYNSMPHSAIAVGCVDFVLPSAEIARELIRIARQPRVLKNISAAPEDDELLDEGGSDLNKIFMLLRTVLAMSSLTTNTLPSDGSSQLMCCVETQSRATIHEHGAGVRWRSGYSATPISSRLITHHDSDLGPS